MPEHFETETTMPKIPTKKVLTITGILIVGALVAVSLWFNFQTYWTKYKSGIYQQGRAEVMNQIVSQLQNTGQVILTSPQGNIILIPKQ